MDSDETAGQPREARVASRLRQQVLQHRFGQRPDPHAMPEPIQPSSTHRASQPASQRLFYIPPQTRPGSAQASMRKTESAAPLNNPTQLAISASASSPALLFHGYAPRSRRAMSPSLAQSGAVSPHTQLTRGSSHTMSPTSPETDRLHHVDSEAAPGVRKGGWMPMRDHVYEMDDGLDEVAGSVSAAPDDIDEFISGTRRMRPISAGVRSTYSYSQESAVSQPRMVRSARESESAQSKSLNRPGSKSSSLNRPHSSKSFVTVFATQEVSQTGIRVATVEPAGKSMDKPSPTASSSTPKQPTDQVWWSEFMHQNKEEREKLLWKTYCPNTSDDVIKRFRRKKANRQKSPRKERGPKVDYAKRYQKMLEQLSYAIQEKIRDKEAKQFMIEEERKRFKKKLGLDSAGRRIQPSASLSSITPRETIYLEDPKPKLSAEERSQINFAILQRQKQFLQSLLEKKQEEQNKQLIEAERMVKAAAKLRDSVLSRLQIDGSRRDLDDDSNARGSTNTTTEDISFWKRKNILNENSKVFCVQGGYEDIRNELLLRGWVENPDAQSNLFDLKWTTYAADINFRMLSKRQQVNHFEGVEMLTTKLGLCKSLRQLTWLESEDLDKFYPRCYDLGDESELKEFIDDFRITLVEGIVKKLVEYQGDALSVIRWGENVPERITNHPKACRIPHYIVNMALRACSFHLESLLLQESLREDVTPVSLCRSIFPLSDDEWEILMTLSTTKFKITLGLAHLIFCELEAESKGLKMKGKGKKYHFDFDEPPSEADMLASAISVSKELRSKSRQFELNGLYNIWIIKPSGSSKGFGVRCTQDLKTILAGKNENARVVQKYVEVPYLIKEHKFDLRQWVLVTSWDPLVIWFYKDCVLRFASEKYDVEDTENKYVHLCNYSVQKLNEKVENEIGSLSWTSEEFLNYIRRESGDEGLWHSKTRPLMKDIVIWSFRCSQPYIRARQNTFELYGIDFILDRLWNPWLIEVNSSPGLRASPLLAKKMLRDIVKVVVDVPASGVAPKVSHFQSNKMGSPSVESETSSFKAKDQQSPEKIEAVDTGGWELIFRETVVSETTSSGAFDMLVEGKKVSIPKVRSKAALAKEPSTQDIIPLTE